jgi:hypothetical protein
MRLFDVLDVAQASDALPDGGEVGQGSTEPALVYVELPARGRGLFDCFLRLFLATDEKHLAPSAGDLAEECSRLLKLPDCLTEIDDLDGVPRLENERLHLRVPPLGLVTKMDTCLEKFRHQFSGHESWLGSGE